MIMHTKKFHVSGMKCQGCVQNVLQALNSINGIHAEVSLEQASATVESESDINTGQLIQAIKAAGYQAKADD